MELRRTLRRTEDYFVWLRNEGVIPRFRVVWQNAGEAVCNFSLVRARLLNILKPTL